MDKICTRCKLPRSIEEFPWNGTDRHGNKRRNPACLYCRRIEASAYYKANRERIDIRRAATAKDDYYKRKYGITQKDRDELVEAQKGMCSLGHPTIEFNIDHDHITGKRRGLLCPSCNKGLGFFEDDVERLGLAIEYLKSSRDD